MTRRIIYFFITSCLLTSSIFTVDAQSYSSPSYKLYTIDILSNEGEYELIEGKVNDTNAKFYYQSGVSGVEVSTFVANSYLTNHYISASDIKECASGDKLQEGDIIIIRKLEVGPIGLKDVPATVVSWNRPPIVIGKSLFKNYSTVRLDPSKKFITVLKIIK